MASMMTKNCANCGCSFRTRVSDHLRGWGVFCSKSCKAKNQTRNTGISGPNSLISGVSVIGYMKGDRSKKHRSKFDVDRV